MMMLLCVYSVCNDCFVTNSHTPEAIASRGLSVTTAAAAGGGGGSTANDSKGWLIKTSSHMRKYVIKLV